MISELNLSELKDQLNIYKQNGNNVTSSTSFFQWLNQNNFCFNFDNNHELVAMNFNEVNLTQITFFKSKLDRSTFKKSNLKQVIFKEASLNSVDITEAEGLNADQLVDAIDITGIIADDKINNLTVELAKERKVSKQKDVKINEMELLIRAFIIKNNNPISSVNNSTAGGNINCLSININGPDISTASRQVQEFIKMIQDDTLNARNNRNSMMYGN